MCKNSGMPHLASGHPQTTDKPIIFRWVCVVFCFSLKHSSRLGQFAPKILLKQYVKICEKWEKGLEKIKNMPVCEFSDMAYYGYSLFKSSSNQLRFYKHRNEEKYSAEKLDIVKDEMRLAKEVYKILVRNCAVGYEAANHYYVCKKMLAKKILQCEYTIRQA